MPARLRWIGYVCCLSLLFAVRRARVGEDDDKPYTGISPGAAVKKMALPPGFKATLFAGEPDVKQPIAFAIDDRGRLWVAEAYTYPTRFSGNKGLDRILAAEHTQ